MNDIYTEVTNRIIARLEAGEIPWSRGWDQDGRLPMNLVSGRCYQGINTMILWSMRSASPFWLTFKQAQELGGTVRNGEKASPVVFWKFLDRSDEETGKRVRIPMLRKYSVFNLTQCEGIPESKLPESIPLRDHSPIEAAERIVAGYAGKPVITHGFNHAAYAPMADRIEMPEPGRFHQPENYYKTLFHELTHSTGHSSRLNRDMSGSFGAGSYGREELIAEMGAAFLCAACGILPAVEERSVAYLQGWIDVLKADSRALIVAGGAAQKAANLIRGIVPEPVESEAVATG